MECFFVRERVASLEVSLMKIDDKMQVVDFLTKAIGFNQLHYLLGNMGISNLHSPSWGGVLDIDNIDIVSLYVHI